MERDRSWKKADYPNRIPSWIKSRDIKYNNLAGKRDLYLSKLTWDSHPKDYLKNYKLYVKYSNLTKTKIDPEKEKIAKHIRIIHR